MSATEYIKYHGLLLPLEAHTTESLEYAQNFCVEDTDVFGITYPKSGMCLFSYLLSLFSFSSCLWWFLLISFSFHILYMEEFIPVYLRNLFWWQQNISKKLRFGQKNTEKGSDTKNNHMEEHFKTYLVN